MNNNHRPSDADLPSATKLLKSTFVAVTLAALILVTVVLPAEYGIDPTGIGSMIGLTKMGEIKVSLAEEAAAEKAAVKPVEAAAKQVTVSAPKTAEKVIETQVSNAVNSDSITVSLEPNQGREVKVKMLKGGKVSYKWKASNGRANFDIHGDSAKLRINYHNYSKGSSENSEGVLEAAFDGKHGWFWRNRTGKAMTITLEVEGEFTEMTQEV